jgi:hypothetical protein
VRQLPSLAFLRFWALPGPELWSFCHSQVSSCRFWASCSCSSELCFARTSAVQVLSFALQVCLCRWLCFTGFEVELRLASCDFGVWSCGLVRVPFAILC